MDGERECVYKDKHMWASLVKDGDGDDAFRAAAHSTQHTVQIDTIY